jgi:hypothetical protein
MGDLSNPGSRLNPLKNVYGQLFAVMCAGDRAVSNTQVLSWASGKILKPKTANTTVEKLNRLICSFLGDEA